MDEVRLTLPEDPRFHPVAHLVLGGVGSRVALTVEGLDDLRLALENLLQRSTTEGEVTVRLRIEGATLVTEVGPFASGALERELADERREGLGLRRILDTVADAHHVRDGEHGSWVLLEKRLSG